MDIYEITIRSSAVPVSSLAIQWEYPETEEGISYGTPYYWIGIEWDDRPRGDRVNIDTFEVQAADLDAALERAAWTVKDYADVMYCGKGYVPVCMVNVTNTRPESYTFSCGTWEPCLEFLARHLPTVD
jgi:hypothetical protein